MIKRGTWINWLCYFSILTYVGMCLQGLFFGNINIWDEAIYVNNAIEMYFSQDLLTLQVDGKPSYYNVKPPLVIWLQTICISIFGISEFSVRLPSALAGIGIGLLVLWFSKTVLKEYRIGVLTLVILMGCTGFFRDHVIWSGDLDAPMLFFIVGYTLVIYKILFTDQATRRIYLWLALFAIGAYMSKSIAGWIPILGLFLSVIFDKQSWNVLGQKKIYVAAFTSLAIVILYYLIRSSGDAFYFQSVVNSEFKRLTENIAPWLNGPWNYYWHGIYCRGFMMPFLLLVPVIPFSIIYNRTSDKVQDRFIQAGFIWIIVYFLVISYPDVKLEWYDAPLYPIVALVLATVVFNFLDYVKGTWLPSFQFFFPVILLLALLPGLYNYAQNARPRFEQEIPGDYLKYISMEYPQYKSINFIYSTKYVAHQDQLKFYKKQLEHHQDYNIQIHGDVKVLALGDTIASCSPVDIASVRSTYSIMVIDSSNCLLGVINKMLPTSSRD